MEREMSAEESEKQAKTLVRAASDLPIREHILMVNDLPRGQKYFDAMQAKIQIGRASCRERV